MIHFLWFGLELIGYTINDPRKQLRNTNDVASVNVVQSHTLILPISKDPDVASKCSNLTMSLHISLVTSKVSGICSVMNQNEASDSRC